MCCAFHGSGNREFTKLLQKIESLETMTYPSRTQVLGNARISIPHLARMLSDFFLAGDSANQRLHQVWHLKPYCNPWDAAQIPEVSPKSRCHGIKLKLQSFTESPHTQKMRQLSPPSPNSQLHVAGAGQSWQLLVLLVLNLAASSPRQPAC